MPNGNQNQEERRYMPLRIARSMNNFFAVAGEKNINPTLAVYAAREAVGQAPEDASWYIQGIVPFLERQTIRDGRQLSDAALDLINSYASVFVNGAQLNNIYAVLQETGYQGYIPTYLNNNLTIAEAIEQYRGDENRNQAIITINNRLRENTRTRLYNRIASDSLQNLEERITEAETQTQNQTES